MTLSELVTLDRESVTVWPCLREERLGDWILRFGGGVYGRSNSVQPFGDPTIPIAEAVESCEAAYRAERLPSMFRLPHLGDWQELDRHLAARGYEINDSAIVQVGHIASPPMPESVKLLETPNAEWLASYFAGSGRGAGREAAVEQLLHRVPPPRRFAAVHQGERLVAIGLGSIHNDTLWMFGIATVPDSRGQGHGQRICEALMAWAKREGARRAALQVSSSNTPALRLYDRLGFENAYEYTYRRKLLEPAANPRHV
jgi:ribosomal protein S18 acetylase RimI-like enzyme